MIPAHQIVLLALRAGTADVLGAGGDDLWASWFRDWPVAERDRWLVRFRAKPPAIVLGYPRRDSTIPIWACLLSSERDNRRAIGDRVAWSKESGDVIGCLEDETLSIHLWADSPDEVVVHHVAIKRMLRGRQKWIIQTLKADQLLYEGAMDVPPDPEYTPEELHVRVQTWMVTGLAATYTDLGPPTPGADAIYTFMETATVDGVKGKVKPE